MRENGFVYGFNAGIPKTLKKTYDYSPDEIAKINLLFSHYYTFRLIKQNDDFEIFSKHLSTFYKLLEFQNKSLWRRITGGLDSSGRLEMLLHERVHLGNNMLTRSFQRSIANALLFVDVLAFKAFLNEEEEIKNFATNLENIIMTISFDAGEHIAQYGNESLGQQYSALFNESYFFNKPKQSLKKHNKKLLNELNFSEKRYLTDLTSAICYSDYNFTEIDRIFVLKMVKEMQLDEIVADESMLEIQRFYEKNKKIKKQNSGSNPVFNFYDNSSVFISKLIQRNRSRIVKEIQQSKELMNLLIKSRRKPLSIEEQKRAQLLLLDILKTIPSFAIFMLPGGAILLPLFAKILPNLLPSSFDDNKI